MGTGLVLFLITYVSLVELSQGLRCRVDHDQRTQEGFQDVVRACMSSDLQDHGRRPHKTNNSWQHKRPEWGQGIPRFPTRDNRDGGGGGSGQEEEDGEDSSSRETTEYKNNRGRGGGGGGGGGGGSYNRGRGPRSRRAAQLRPQPHSNRRRDQSRDLNQNHGFNQNQNHNHTENQHHEASVLENIEPCVIHCIFQQMQMLDKDNQPDRAAILNVMTGQLRDQELRRFLRDAISECFESLESESQDTRCSASKSFAMCLEQKGQQNCEDWNDDIKIPYNKQGSFINNHNSNNNYKNRG